MYGMTFGANTFIQTYTARQNIWNVNIITDSNYKQPVTTVLVHKIAPHTQSSKFWWGKFIKHLAGICQLNLLRSCFASLSGQQKCVWFGVNLSSHFDKSFSLHFPFFNWRRRVLKQPSENALVHQDCSPSRSHLTSTDQSVTVVLLHSPASLLHSRTTISLRPKFAVYNVTENEVY